MVRAELDQLLSQGLLKSGDTVSEISAGSTALSLAHHCRVLKLKCVLFVPQSLPGTMIDSLQTQGAELHLVDPKNAYSLYDDFTAKHGTWKLNQVADRNLRRHYRPLGKSLHDLGRITLIIGCVGTGHSLVGIGEGFGSLEALVSAEPLLPQSVPGIRNLCFESMGEKDPYEYSQTIPRIEVNGNDASLFQGVETDQGPIEAPPSFGVALGCVDVALSEREPTSVFVIGAANRRFRI